MLSQEGDGDRLDGPVGGGQRRLVHLATELLLGRERIKWGEHLVVLSHRLDDLDQKLHSLFPEELH